MRATTVTPLNTRERQRSSHQPSHSKPNGNKFDSSQQTAATKTENYYQLVARATNDAVRDWNLVTDALIWRQGLDTLLGWKPASGDTILFWQKRVHPDDRAWVTASIRDAIKSDADHWSGEYRFRRADGTYLNVLERAMIHRDKTGGAKRFVGVLMEITARRHLHDQLVHSQKMEAFGQLAGGVAHDFNNLLTAILGYSDLAIAEIDGRSTIGKYLSEIRTAASRASSLTQQLLAFSRSQPAQPRVLDVNALVSDLERSILRLLGENIAITCELLPEDRLAHIRIDQSQFTQIMLNIALNARDAMPAGGRLILRTETVTISATAQHPKIPDLAPADYVVFSLIDNGGGMSEEIKARIFEPFFTTKEDRNGSGLGLATCYRLIRQNGGQIVFESELGQGTKAHIYLPRVPNPAPSITHKRQRLSSMPTGRETVLVVEDDLSVRHVTVRTLRLLGYNVVEAMRADEAKRCITEHPESIDLVVSDIVLPDISGRDFAKWTRAHSPRTQVVLISGYLPYVTSGDEDSFPACLPKPFDPEQLASAVRSALDAALVN
jgi:two-component system cell cycle sensor histidine kinase/response regulator CckA